MDENDQFQHHHMDTSNKIANIIEDLDLEEIQVNQKQVSNNPFGQSNNQDNLDKDNEINPNKYTFRVNMSEYEKEHEEELDNNFGQMARDNAIEFTQIPPKVYCITF